MNNQKIEVVSARSSHNKPSESYKKSRIYIFIDGENVMENLQNRRDRPYEFYKKEILSLPEVQALFPIETKDIKFKWSQKAGCSCGCSPGFMVEGWTGSEYFITVKIGSTQNPEPTEEAVKVQEALPPAETKTVAKPKKATITDEERNQIIAAAARTFQIVGSDLEQLLSEEGAKMTIGVALEAVLDADRIVSMGRLKSELIERIGYNEIEKLLKKNRTAWF